MWDSAHRQDPEDVEAAVLFVPQQHRSVEPDRLQVGVEFRFLPFGVTGMTYTVDLTGCSAAETPGDPHSKSRDRFPMLRMLLMSFTKIRKS